MESTLVTGSGIAGIIVALVYAGRLTLDWFKERRTGKVASSSAVVGDAATANTILVQTVTSLQGENARLVSRVIYLEAEDAKKDRKITELQHQIAGIAAELEKLRNH